MSHHRLGIDVGGTFTDAFLLEDETGSLTFHKVASKADDPGQPVLAAIRDLADQTGMDPSSVGMFVHGTTLALNTLIERSGTDIGVLITKGFRDLLELGRGRLPVIHDFYVQSVESIVRRDRVAEIDERLYATGEVRKPIDPADLEKQAQMLLARGARAIAVCFLHAYINPVHEELAFHHLQQAYPNIPVYASHRVWPQAREYERAMATVINAYVAGPMKSYYDRLQRGLADLGLRAPIYVSRSAGGIMSVASAASNPVETLLSGPAAGVLGASYIAAAAGEHKIICLDMGGTTTDVSVVDGQPRYVYETELGGFTLTLPSIDIESIGAGGGSIAWLDPAGVLRVGPRSAGAVPGPAAYGRGGKEPTVTDAYVALGYIHPRRFLGGQLPLNAEFSKAALSRIARQTDETVGDAAWQIVSVATANMYAQLMPLLSRQGVDPSEFALVPYGGAGPTQAFFLAEEIGISRLLIPPTPGGVSALGSLIADLRADFVRTMYGRLDTLQDHVIEETLLALEEQALAWLEREKAPLAAQYCLRSADLRYAGQSFEIHVALDGSASPAAVADAFHRQHDAVYGHSDPTAPVEIVNVRVQVVGVTPDPKWTSPPAAADIGRDQERRVARFEGGEQEVQVYQRTQIQSGHEISGPAIIEQYDSTVVVPPGWSVQTDDFGNLHANYVGEVMRSKPATKRAIPFG